MESKRRCGWWMLAWFCALTLLTGMYVAAYYVTAKRGVPLVVRLPSGRKGFRCSPHYPHQIRDVANFVFDPVHQIDRKLIRPQFWNPPKGGVIIDTW